ncbi:hypothetical protein F4774DRAFT_413844 [Daldinia eschscholtzii]|nr:hypothetical protein F4774DRAFT_413844 [Daldinia eschscholtzii]
MDSTNSTALEILVRTPPGKMVTHEIILVHGFKLHSDDPKHLYKFKNILENWIKIATDPIRDRVNVRTFAFDGDHVLHNGKNGLSDATIELSKKFAATSEDPSSPLFRPRVDDKASRAAVFIAHGLGTWVVKDFLVLFRKASNRVDPTGLVFLDALETPPDMTPVDVRSSSAVSRYLFELADIYKTQAMLKINELQEKLRIIDMNFRLLTNSRYGVCKEAKDMNEDRNLYTMKMWCNNVWMSSNPRLTIESSMVKSFIRGFRNIIRVDKLTKIKEQLKKLEPLKLPECLQEATDLRRFYDVQPDDKHDDVELIASPSVSQGTSLRSHNNKKGKQKANSPSSPIRRRRILIPSNSMKPLRKIPEEQETEHHQEQAYGFRPDPALQTYGNKFYGEKFYDFDDAVVQRNEAAETDDQEALAAAQSRLQLVKWQQDQDYGKSHPKVLITQREIITTSLASGMWNGKPIEEWTLDDFREIEYDMRHTFEGLEESLGPLHQETLESLTVLFSVRVSLVKIKILPWASVAKLLDTMTQRLDDRAVFMPDLMLDTLKIKYKIALSLAQISEQGDRMLADLLKEVEDLVLTTGRSSVTELTALSFNILERISEVREMRDGEDAAAEEVEQESRI